MLLDGLRTVCQGYNMSVGPTHRHIVVVEDNAFQRLAMIDLLSLCNYKVTAFEHGGKALEYLDVTNEQVHLILCDIIMPEVGGIEFLQRVKSNIRLCHIPVVMMSANEEISVVSTCIECGARDYIIKPIKLQSVRSFAQYFTTSFADTDDDEAPEYETISRLGFGASGSVHLVRRLSDGKLFAHKEISTELLQEEAKQRAENEVTLLKVLFGPTIIRYVDSWVDMSKETINIIMEYGSGGSLGERIEKMKNEGTKFSTQQIFSWVAQMSLACMIMHMKNILHRDLKSQNIFLTDSDIVKVGDFGIAKSLNTSASLAKTAIGTPLYMAPELWKGEPYGDKADIFALGAVLYELITLSRPFDVNHSLQSLQVAICTQDPPPLPSNTDPVLAALCGWLLDKESNRRPNAHEILLVTPVHSALVEFLSYYYSSNSIGDENTGNTINNDIIQYLDTAYNNRRTILPPSPPTWARVNVFYDNQSFHHTRGTTTKSVPSAGYQEASSLSSVQDFTSKESLKEDTVDELVSEAKEDDLTLRRKSSDEITAVVYSIINSSETMDDENQSQHQLSDRSKIKAQCQPESKQIVQDVADVTHRASDYNKHLSDYISQNDFNKSNGKSVNNNTPTDRKNLQNKPLDGSIPTIPTVNQNDLAANSSNMDNNEQNRINMANGTLNIIPEIKTPTSRLSALKNKSYPPLDISSIAPLPKADQHFGKNSENKVSTFFNDLKPVKHEVSVSASSTILPITPPTISGDSSNLRVLSPRETKLTCSVEMVKKNINEKEVFTGEETKKKTKNGNYNYIPIWKNGEHSTLPFQSNKKNQNALNSNQNYNFDNFTSSNISSSSPVSVIQKSDDQIPRKSPNIPHLNVHQFNMDQNQSASPFPVSQSDLFHSPCLSSPLFNSPLQHQNGQVIEKTENLLCPPARHRYQKDAGIFSNLSLSPSNSQPFPVTENSPSSRFNKSPPASATLTGAASNVSSDFGSFSNPCPVSISELLLVIDTAMHVLPEVFLVKNYQWQKPECIVSAGVVREFLISQGLTFPGNANAIIDFLLRENIFTVKVESQLFDSQKVNDRNESFHIDRREIPQHFLRNFVTENHRGGNLLNSSSKQTDVENIEENKSTIDDVDSRTKFMLSEDFYINPLSPLSTTNLNSFPVWLRYNGDLMSLNDPFDNISSCIQKANYQAKHKIQEPEGLMRKEAIQFAKEAIEELDAVAISEKCLSVLLSFLSLFHDSIANPKCRSDWLDKTPPTANIDYSLSQQTPADSNESKSVFPPPSLNDKSRSYDCSPVSDFKDIRPVSNTVGSIECMAVILSTLSASLLSRQYTLFLLLFNKLARVPLPRFCPGSPSHITFWLNLAQIVNLQSLIVLATSKLFNSAFLTQPGHFYKIMALLPSGKNIQPNWKAKGIFGSHPLVSLSPGGTFPTTEEYYKVPSVMDTLKNLFSSPTSFLTGNFDGISGVFSLSSFVFSVGGVCLKLSDIIDGILGPKPNTSFKFHLSNELKKHFNSQSNYLQEPEPMYFNQKNYMNYAKSNKIDISIHSIMQDSSTMHHLTNYFKAIFTSTTPAQLPPILLPFSQSIIPFTAFLILTSQRITYTSTINSQSLSLRRQCNSMAIRKRKSAFRSENNFQQMQDKKQRMPCQNKQRKIITPISNNMNNEISPQSLSFNIQNSSVMENYSRLSNTFSGSNYKYTDLNNNQAKNFKNTPPHTKNTMKLSSNKSPEYYPKTIGQSPFSNIEDHIVHLESIMFKVQSFFLSPSEPKSYHARSRLLNKMTTSLSPSSISLRLKLLNMFEHSSFEETKEKELLQSLITETGNLNMQRQEKKSVSNSQDEEISFLSALNNISDEILTAIESTMCLQQMQTPAIVFSPSTVFEDLSSIINSKLNTLVDLSSHNSFFGSPQSLASNQNSTSNNVLKHEGNIRWTLKLTCPSALKKLLYESGNIISIYKKYNSNSNDLHINNSQLFYENHLYVNILFHLCSLNPPYPGVGAQALILNKLPIHFYNFISQIFSSSKNVKPINIKLLGESIGLTRFETESLIALEMSKFIQWEFY